MKPRLYLLVRDVAKGRAQGACVLTLRVDPRGPKDPFSSVEEGLYNAKKALRWFGDQYGLKGSQSAGGARVGFMDSDASSRGSFSILRAL